MGSPNCADDSSNALTCSMTSNTLNLPLDQFSFDVTSPDDIFISFSVESVENLPSFKESSEFGFRALTQDDYKYG